MNSLTNKNISEAELNSYRFNSGKEPTDEMLVQIMRGNFGVANQSSKPMKRFVTYICVLMACLVCCAKEITISPQFSVGDTLKYRTTAKVIMYHGSDSLVTVTKLLPTIFVEAKNNKGFLLRTINKLEAFEIECTDPESKGLLPDRTEELNDFVASRILQIQLDTDCRPDTILNMEEVKESVLNAYVKMLERELGTEIDVNEAPFVIGAVSDICNQKHLIEEQFGNIPYFNFIGIPLKSGKIPASMVLTDKLQTMCHGLKDLKMDVAEGSCDMECSTDETDGFYSIKVKGKKGNTEVVGQFLFADGIIAHGFLNVRAEDETGKITSIFNIEPAD